MGYTRCEIRWMRDTIRMRLLGVEDDTVGAVVINIFDAVDITGSGGGVEESLDAAVIGL